MKIDNFNPNKLKEANYKIEQKIETLNKKLPLIKRLKLFFTRFTKMRNILFLIIFTFVVVGCKGEPQINIYDESLKTNKLKCLKLIPKNKSNLENELKKLYNFSDNCPYALELSYKSGIVCTSPYSASKGVYAKAYSAYLTLEVKKGIDIKYSYYIDLDDKPDFGDLKDAFNQLKDDIL